MSIRKDLCKKFDRENKGYVTIEDITDKILTGEFITNTICTIMVVASVTLLMIIIGSSYNQGIGNPTNQSLFEVININNFMTGLLISSLITLIFMTLHKFWKYIKILKVVVCPFKINNIKGE